MRTAEERKEIFLRRPRIAASLSITKAVLIGALVIGGCDRGAGEAESRLPAVEPSDMPMMEGSEMPMMGSEGQRMPEWMMSGSMDSSMMDHMRVIHTLLVNHQSIERTVTRIPGGVETTTTSRDAAVAEAIRTHVRQMKSRVEEGRAIRRMDPLFREIFEHHEAIRMEITNLDDGVRVRETSNDPKVVALIRQHAERAVSEFVDQGMSRAMRRTPLPDGYRSESGSTAGR